MLVTFGIYFKQHFDTRYLVFYNPSPPRLFLSLDLLSEYRIQHGTDGPLYVTSSYSTWIFCRGVSGFATDCPCGVWCRGLTTCLLHVGPPFGNRVLNSRDVGLTSWIIYLIFCVLTYAIIYVLIHQIIFRFYLLKYPLVFSNTRVLTSSIDVVFILSNRRNHIQRANSQQFWKIRKSITKQRGCDYDLVNEDGTKITDPNEHKVHMAKYYENLYTAREGNPLYEK